MPLLSVAAHRWSQELPRRFLRYGRPFSERLLSRAVSLCIELSESQPELVVCHQDLHGGNVLPAGAERWLAIDPKPLLGERAFDLASPLRDRPEELLAAPSPARAMRRQRDLLTETTGTDPDRARGWAIVHALAWGLSEEGVYRDAIACAELLERV